MFCSEGYFPASGFHRLDIGTLGGVGVNAFCIASSSRGIGTVNLGYLSVSSSFVGPLSNDGRSNAYPVRCVQAFIKCYFCIWYRTLNPECCK